MWLFVHRRHEYLNSKCTSPLARTARYFLRIRNLIVKVSRTKLVSQLHLSTFFIGVLHFFAAELKAARVSHLYNWCLTVHSASSLMTRLRGAASAGWVRWESWVLTVSDSCELQWRSLELSLRIPLLRTESHTLWFYGSCWKRHKNTHSALSCQCSVHLLNPPGVDWITWLVQEEQHET